MGDQYLAQRIDEILRQKIAMGAGVQAGWAKGRELTKKAKAELARRKKEDAKYKAELGVYTKQRRPPIKNPYKGKPRKAKKVADDGMPEKAVKGYNKYNDFRLKYKKDNNGSSKGVVKAWHKHNGSTPRKSKKKADKKVVKAAGLLLQDLMGSGLLSRY